MSIRIEPLEGPVGAVVHGIDSRRPLDAEDFAAVEQAMFDHIEGGWVSFDFWMETLFSPFGMSVNS